MPGLRVGAWLNSQGRFGQKEYDLWDQYLSGCPISHICLISHIFE